MKNRYSRKQLVGKSIALFKERTEAVLFATSDGQFFVFKDRANMHATSHKSPLTVYEIERKDVEEEINEPAPETSGSTESPKTVKVIKAEVATITEVEALEKMLEAEKALEDPRKTAIEAIEDRIAELKEPKTED
jgi:hypothetical protein